MTAARKTAARKPRKKPSPSLSVVAREAEAGDGYVTVEQCGLELQIPIKGKVPFKAILAFREGDEFLGSELLLGPEQWDALMEKNPTLDDMNEIGRKISEATGNS